MTLPGKNTSTAGSTVVLDKFSASLPIRVPAAGNLEPGRFSMASITYDRRHTADAKGSVQWHDSEPTDSRQIAKDPGGSGRRLSVDGRARIHDFPDMKLAFNSDVRLDDGPGIVASIQVDPFTLKDRDVKKFWPDFPKKTTLSLTTALKASFRMDKRGVEGRMTLDIKDGIAEMAEIKLAAAGIRSTIVLDSLLPPRSAPGQMLFVDTLNIDQIKMENLKLRFSLENINSFLLENIRFNWCQGLVSSESIRFPQPSDTYSLILYCDRLDLTQLLGQVGAFHAEGSGSLNGRLPVTYTKGDISFDNGFLFSTPGTSGKIRIDNTDQLTRGIPMDSPQFSQLDLAREALKDFEYEWAKLVFNTHDNSLLVNMELDGKPSRLLPFEYRKDLGRFSRVDASHPGSSFQGIKLDVNLNLPFNEVLKSGNKLRSIFE